jgi:cytochrome c oxidase subunit 1
MLGIMGVGGVLAFTGLLIYILLTVWAVFFGESNKGRAIFDWGTPPIVASQAEAEAAEAEASAGRAPGTMVLVMILLISFVVYYFANWKALADLWWVR